MPNIYAESNTAKKAFELVKELQVALVKELESLPGDFNANEKFAPVEWARSDGKFGGGIRFVAQNPRLFNRASVNISQVQYEQDPSKALASATAISAIVHPLHPFAPSMHMHISWTELKSETGPLGYWRIMADLNPSHPNEEDTKEFENAFSSVTPEEAIRQLAIAQGNRYFHIPALDRHRGVAHFYLEEFRSDDAIKDSAFAKLFGETIIKTYGRIVARALSKGATQGETERSTQLAYHTLYFLQVLTLDRGTTSGLLVHNENDVGILGSLPSHVNRELLKAWLPKLPELQQKLLQEIIKVLPDPVTEVVDEIKAKIAESSRAFYKENPKAIDLLARGNVIPPTERNHLTSSSSSSSSS